MDPKYQQTDIDGAVARLDVSRENVMRLIGNFFRRDVLSLIKKAFEEDNRDECRLHVHTLKGSSGSLGFVGLSTFAAEWEKEIIGGAPLEAARMYDLTVLWNELRANFI